MPALAASRVEPAQAVYQQARSAAGDNPSLGAGPSCSWGPYRRRYTAGSARLCRNERALVEPQIIGLPKGLVPQPEAICGAPDK